LNYDDEQLFLMDVASPFEKAIQSLGKLNMPGFEKGEVVALKSGGPRMTVCDVQKDALESHRVRCVWFEKNKKAEDTFDMKVLKKSIIGIRQ